MTPDPDKRVDELRQQLRSLGYLDAGVDRFVLGPARERRGPVAIAARAGVRVGLLGGALLGPAAALGLGARLPGLVSGARDAVVLALYLAVFFFAAVTIASFLVSLAAAMTARTPDARFASRARGASRAAAWTVTIGALLYLTLWWRNANAGFGWSAPAWTAFALVVAVAISLLLGHAVRIATLAVLAARHAGAGLPPIPARSWSMVASGGALAFAGAAALLLMTVSADERLPEIPPLTVVGSRAPIRLIAVDGFDPGTYQRLKERLPTLTSVLSGGYIRLQPQDTSDPARAWTTIATGVPPETHGVHAMETRRVAGLSGAFASGGRLQVVGIASDLLRLTRPSLASSQDRQVKTMWEVADQAGLRTSVVNWWATWPAPDSGGLMITDRGVLRLEHGGPLDAEIGPPSLYDSLRALWPALRERARASVGTAFDAVSDPAVAATLRRSAELDATLIALARTASDRLPAPLGVIRDLDVVYLPGLDIAQSALLGSAESPSASSVASRVDALERYYVFLDRAIAPLLEWREDGSVLLVTQPGRVQSSAGGLFAAWRSVPVPSPIDGGHRPAPTHDAPPSERPAEISRLQPVSVTDVAPTILYALGLPLSRELAGHPVAELFGHVRDEPSRLVPTYGRPFVTSPARAGRPLDQEMIDRLRSLGYIR